VTAPAQEAGVAGGVGTTTLAIALSACDRGVFVGRAADVLVCRSTAESLIRTGRAIQLLSSEGYRPVLAVTPADASRPSRPALARCGVGAGVSIDHDAWVVL
jgi:hypothetical protein